MTSVVQEGFMERVPLERCSEDLRESSHVVSPFSLHLHCLPIIISVSSLEILTFFLAKLVSILETLF